MNDDSETYGPELGLASYAQIWNLETDSQISYYPAWLGRMSDLQVPLVAGKDLGASIVPTASLSLG